MDMGYSWGGGRKEIIKTFKTFKIKKLNYKELNKFYSI